MIHLLQSEYDELLAARDALAVIRDKATPHGMRKHSEATRLAMARYFVGTVVKNCALLGVNVTVSRVMEGPPSMDGLVPSIDVWLNQRWTPEP